jgi:hypothetical protein
MQSAFYDQKSTSEPPVIVQIYTKMTNKTLQQTTSEIARGISSNAITPIKALMCNPVESHYNYCIL